MPDTGCSGCRQFFDDSRITAKYIPDFEIVEIIFGLRDERLTLRHDAGSGADPYIRGALLAIENVAGIKGLRCGLDSVMTF